MKCPKKPCVHDIVAIQKRSQLTHEKNDAISLHRLHEVPDEYGVWVDNIIATAVYDQHLKHRWHLQADAKK